MTTNSTNPFATHPKQFSKFVFAASVAFIPVIWILLYCYPNIQDGLIQPEILQTLIIAQTSLLAIVISITILGVQTTSNLFTGRIQTEFFRTGPFLLVVGIFAFFAVLSAITLIFQNTHPSWKPYMFVTSFWFWLWSLISTLVYLTFVPSIIVPSVLIERYVERRVGKPDEIATEYNESSDEEQSLSEFTDLTTDAVQMGEKDAAKNSLQGIYHMVDSNIKTYEYKKPTPENKIPTRSLVEQALCIYIPRVVKIAREENDIQTINWIVEIYVAIYARSLTLEDGRFAATVESGIMNGIDASTNQERLNPDWEFLKIPYKTSNKIAQQEFEPNPNLLEMMIGLQIRLLKRFSVRDNPTDLIEAGIQSISGGHEVYELVCDTYDGNSTETVSEIHSMKVTEESPPSLQSVESDQHQRFLNEYAHLLSNINHIWDDKIDDWESEPQVELIPNILESSLSKSQDLDGNQTISFAQFYIEAMYLFSEQIKPEFWLSKLEDWAGLYGDRDIILRALNGYNKPAQQMYQPLEPKNHEFSFDIWIDALLEVFKS